jgi:hypothetical protein
MRITDADLASPIVRFLFVTPILALALGAGSIYAARSHSRQTRSEAVS